MAMRVIVFIYVITCVQTAFLLVLSLDWIKLQVNKNSVTITWDILSLPHFPNLSWNVTLCCLSCPGFNKTYQGNAKDIRHSSHQKGYPVEVYDLWPGQQYEVRVFCWYAAEKRNLFSSNSSKDVFNTPEAAPKRAPQHLSIFPRKGEFWLTWKPVPCQYAGGLVTHYEVQLFHLCYMTNRNCTNQNVTNAKAVPKNFIFSVNEKGQYILKDLKDYSRYLVTVRAVTSKGNGPRSSTYESTPSSTPTVRMERTTIQNINVSSAVVTWHNPDNQTGPVNSYKIILKGDNQFCAGRTLKAYRQPYVLSSLCGHTNYTLQVKACYDGECSLPSEPAHFTTPIGALGGVTSLLINRSGSDWRVSWAAPRQRNGPLGGYLLKYGKVNEPLHEKNLSAFETDFSIDCDKWKNSKLKVEVSPFNSFSMGPTKRRTNDVCFKNDDLITKTVFPIVLVIGGAILTVLIYKNRRRCKRESPSITLEPIPMDSEVCLEDNDSDFDTSFGDGYLTN